jgi:hypothetical protein
MQFKLCFTLGLASLATAVQMDGPAIKGLLVTINTGIQNLDKAVLAITDANVATQVAEVTAQITNLNKAITEQSTRIKSSKALGLLDISSLVPSAAPLVGSITKLLTDVLAKRVILVKSNQSEHLLKGLKILKGGSFALQESLLTQVPSNLASQIPKALAIPAGLETVNLVKVEDLVFDVVIAAFKGTDTTIKVSSSVWPLPGAKRSVTFKA